MAQISNTGLVGIQSSVFAFATTPENFITGITETSDAATVYPATGSQSAVYNTLNQLTTLGAIIQVPSFVIFVYNVFASLRHGRPAGADPWDAWTLEWATTSPPPAYNFEVVPTVHSRRPLWDVKHPDDPDWKYEE